MDFLASLGNHLFYAGKNKFEAGSNESHFAAIPAVFLPVLECGPGLFKAADAVLVHTESVVKLLDAVNRNGDAHDLMILMEKVLCCITEPQLAVGGKTDPRPCPKRALALPALLEPVICDFLNQLRLQKRLTADEIQNDALGGLVDEVASAVLVKINNVIDDPFPGFQAHGAAALVVLIAIRTAQIAVTGHLKSDVPAGFQAQGSVVEKSVDKVGIIFASCHHLQCTSCALKSKANSTRLE